MRILPTILLAIACLGPSAVLADEFSEVDVKRWAEQFDGVVKEGRALWTSPDIGKNGVVCAQCHPNAANTHPETYPKFQKQLGKVANLWEMVNWCRRNPLQGEPMKADDPRMTAMLAYIVWERRGVKLEPGKH